MLNRRTWLGAALLSSVTTGCADFFAGSSTMAPPVTLRAFLNALPTMRTRAELVRIYGEPGETHRLAPEGPNDGRISPYSRDSWRRLQTTPPDLLDTAPVGTRIDAYDFSYTDINPTHVIVWVFNLDDDRIAGWAYYPIPRGYDLRVQMYPRLPRTA